MAIAGKFPFLLLLTGAVALSACEEGQGFKPFQPRDGAGAEAAAADADAGPAVVERDVEAPEIFQAAEAGLWDGRPSLGGIWVAHPDVKEPERVMIRNTENGKFVMGALFRRERQNPGPKLQVSSDAAAELGMLAGKPTQLSVVAIRREAVPVEPDAVEPAAGADGESIEATSLGDPVAGMAAAAIDAASGGEAAVKPVPRPDTGAAAASAAPAPAEAKPAATASAGNLQKPYIQIGIFSDKRNADQTSELLRNSGIVPTIKPFESKGKQYWRVVVGPVGTAADRSALLKKVRGLGFGDAYPVTN